MRKYPRLDANHKAIKAEFQRLGCAVLDLSMVGGGVPDLGVFMAGVGMLVEIKDGSKPPSARRLTPDEEAFRNTWTGGWRLVENLEHVKEVVEVLQNWHRAIRRGM